MKKRSGFTLIELLAVIAIVLLLLTLLIPALGRLRRITMRVIDLSNMRQFVSACALYASDNDSTLPISTREGVNNCGYCDDMAWFSYGSFTNIQNYVHDKRIFSCNTLQKDPTYMQYLGESRDCGGSYVPNLPPNRVNGTHVGWNVYFGRIIANCNGGNNPAYASTGVLITNDYQYPLRTGGHATSRTIATCPNWVSGSGAWNGLLMHLDPDDGFRVAPIGYPLWGVLDFPGMNVGYIDGGARWVKTEEMGVFKDVNWMYFDRTR